MDSKRNKRSLVKFETILNLLAPSAPVVAEYLLLLLFVFCFVCVLNLRIRKKLTSMRLPVEFMFNLFSQCEPFFKRASSIGVLYVCTLLFLFLLKTILTNNENVNRVIVDTSMLIDSEEQIYNTKKGKANRI